MWRTPLSGWEELSVGRRRIELLARAAALFAPVTHQGTSGIEPDYATDLPLKMKKPRLPRGKETGRVRAGETLENGRLTSWRAVTLRVLPITPSGFYTLPGLEPGLRPPHGSNRDAVAPSHSPGFSRSTDLGRVTVNQVAVGVSRPRDGGIEPPGFFFRKK